MAAVEVDEAGCTSRRTPLTVARVPVRVALCIVIVALGTFGAAGSASAHAELVETSPAQGSVLEKAPTEVRLRFSEDVSVEQRAVTVLDAEGDTVDAGPARHVDGDDRLVVSSLPPLGDGQYVVGWKAVSNDSHPINGAFVFTVGSVTSGGSVKGLLEGVLDREGGSGSVAATLAVVRALAFLATAVLVGSVLLSLVSPRVEGMLAPHVASPARWAGAVVAVTGVIGWLLQGAYSSGRDLSQVLSGSSISATFGVLGGWLWLYRAVFGVAAWLVARRAASVLIAAVPPLALCAAIAGSGHAVSGPWAPGAFAIDVAHLLSMGAWVGGLVSVVWLLWARGRPDHELARPLVDRFSTISLVAVPVVVATGVAQGVRQLGGFSQLTTTAYGKLLLTKVAIVGLMVALGWFGRIVLRSIAGGDALGHLRRSVSVEAVLAVAVLGVTSILVSSVPAREQVSRPFNQTVVDDSQFVNVTVEPARAGENEVHVTVTPTDPSVGTVADIEVELRLPERDLGPIAVPTERLAANHVIADRVAFPVPGRWQVIVTVRYGEFTSRTTVVPVPIT